MTKNKKRPDHKKLVEAGIEARRILAKRGFIKSDEESAIVEILKRKDAPILPGYIAYLPYQWTLNASKRMMFDLTAEWLDKYKKDIARQENVDSFFKFVISRMDEEQSKNAKEMKSTVKYKKYDLKLLNQKDIINGIKKFFIDSFAVAVIAKSNDSVSSYIEWFDSWTKSLLDLWTRK
jgi:hypothetical protein